MDPVTHTMVGAALADAGGRRYTPLAMTTLILAANAPDVDIVAQFGGTYTGLAWRRGITHGLPALVLLPLVVLGVVMALDRLLRWRKPDRPAARPGPTLALAFLGVLTHPFLDWLNTYGMRWLMPIDGRWFYGDSVFIVDPWLWLGLGGVLFALHSGRTSMVLAWAALAAAMSYLVLFQPIVPAVGKGVWAAGLLAFVALRVVRGANGTGTASPHGADGTASLSGIRMARLALGGASVYIAGMIALDLAADRSVRSELAAAGIEGVQEVMVGPQPANPFAGSVVAATAGGYHLGTFHWFRSPRTEIARTIALPSPRPEILAAIQTEDAQNFLVWSRFPFYEVEETGDGYTVRIGDARYANGMGGGGLGGLVVHLDRDYRPR